MHFVLKKKEEGEGERETTWLHHLNFALTERIKVKHFRIGSCYCLTLKFKGDCQLVVEELLISVETNSNTINVTKCYWDMLEMKI